MLKKFISFLIITPMLFLCSTGVVNASVMSQVTATPASVVSGTTTNYTFVFTTVTSIANNGKIDITFPAGFNVSGATFSSWVGFDGNETLSVVDQTITITRTSGTTSIAGSKSIVLSNIINTATTGNNYQVTVTTKNSSNVALDGPTGSIYFQIFSTHSETNIDGIYYLRNADQNHYQNVGDLIGAGFDMGTLLRTAPTSTEINTCSSWVQYFFDENGTYAQTNQISNIYYHTWWATDGGSAEAGYDVAGTYDGYVYNESFPVTSDSVPKTNDFYLYAGKQTFASPQSILGNAIYNFSEKLTVSAGTRMRVKSSPSQPSFVIFNLPSDVTLQGLDSDSDTLSDYDELFTYKTNPYNNDTDGDGFTDNYEVANSMNPNDPESATAYGKWLLHQYDGVDAGGAFGTSIASIGDIDADGKQDVLVGVPYASPEGLRRGGSVYIYSSATGDLLKQYNGIARDGFFGTLVSSIDDIDADGKQDVLIGAVNKVFIYSSNTGNLIRQFDGDISSGFGQSSLTTIDDIDADGKQDVLIGASTANLGGSAYIYSSANGDLLKQYNAGSADAGFGISIAAIDDIDGDGKQDVIIGAKYVNDSAGSVYVYSSGSGNLIRQYDGVDVSGAFGTSVASVNDIDGDGKQDVLIGSPDSSYPVYNYYFRGSAFLYSSGVSKNLLQRYNGNFTYDNLGQSVSAIDDIDADGKQDVLIGTATEGPIINTNVAYAAIYSSGTGIKIKEYRGISGEAFGSPVVAINDIDNDGKQDVLIGARNANSGVGSVYLYSSTGYIAPQTWSKGSSKTNSFDLDDYFVDPNNSTIPARSQTATYVASTADNPFIDVTIGAGNVVTFSQPAEWLGTEHVVFTSTDSTGLSSTSNSIALTVSGSASTDMVLSDLAISSGTLTPAFTAEITSYSVNVSNNILSIDVTPTANQDYATITVNGDALASGQASGDISLDVGSNIITIVVTAQDGTTTNTYTITVTRDAPTIVPPTVTVQDASSVATSSVVFNGTITVDGYASSTIVGFNYGTTTNYGSVASTTGTFGTESFSKTITGLLSDTLYHFQAFAQNSAGIGTSSDATTTTDAIPDLTLPQFSSISSGTPGQNSATITWTTDKLSSSKVNYGLTSTLTDSTVETNTSPRIQAHTVTLSNLVSCTTYHYSVYSADVLVNTATSSDATFTTSGCSGNTSLIGQTNQSISTTGTTTLVNNSKSFVVNLPTSFSATTTSVVVQIKSLDRSSVIGSLGNPSGSLSSVGNIVFDVKALVNSTTTLDSFSIPVTISYQYSNADISGFNESTLWMYHYHNEAWIALDSCEIDTDTKTISCTAPSFSIFALFGQPSVTPSTQNSIRSQGTSVQTRVKNLISIGNINAVNDLKKQYAYLFPNENLIEVIQTPVKYSQFTHDLKLGMTGEDVKELQQYLNINGFIVAEKGPGSPGKETTIFGPATKLALIKFQNANRNEILIPAGLSYGTGLFGPSTRNFINQKIMGITQNIQAQNSESTPLPIQIISTSSKVNFTMNLGLGDVNEQVRLLQKTLNSLGFIIATSGAGSKGKETTKFGPATKSALIKFQKANKVSPATGYFGPITKALINGLQK